MAYQDYRDLRLAAPTEKFHGTVYWLFTKQDVYFTWYSDQAAEPGSPMEETTRTWVGSTRTRTKIIEATARAVLANGLRVMTVQDILDEAKLSRRTFYEHFRSKEEAALALYRSVSRELIREVHAGFKSVDTLEKRLHAGVDAYLRFQREVGDLVTLLHAEAADPGSILAPQHHENVTALSLLLGNEVREALGVSMEPQLLRALVLGMEGLCAFHRDHGVLTPPPFPRVSIALRALLGVIVDAAPKLPRSTEDD